MTTKMRKFKCSVTIEKEVIVWIPDEFLTIEEIAAFESAMFDVGSSESGLVKYIAEQASKDVPFIEGVGAPTYQISSKQNPFEFSVFVFESDVTAYAKEIQNDN